MDTGEHHIRRRLSLRLKLTLWMVVLFLVVQLSLAFVFRLFQQRSINEYFNARITARLEQVAADLRPQLGSLTNQQAGAIAENYRRLLLQKQFALAVYNEAGQAVASSRPGAKMLPTDVWARVRDPNASTVVYLANGDAGSGVTEPVRWAARWLTASDGGRFLLLVGWSDVYASELQRLLAGVFFVGIPIGVVAVAISAYVISGAAIQPFRAIRHMAKGLDPEFLGERLEMPGLGLEAAELQQSLERTRQRLEIAFNAQERFMSSVSHELKTPIAVLMTEAQNLRLDRADKDVRSFVDSTKDELDKLGRMVDSFLLLTRVRHGKATVPNQEHCLVRDIMVESFEGCIGMAQQHDVRLSIRLPEGEHLDAGVRGNCDLLRTVLDNLIRNAIRFSPRSSVVEVMGSVEEDRLILRVSDSGPGIPPTLLPRIFDRFAQSTEEQRRGRGHGLGLEIAMGITELHGGTIRAENRVAGGCEFTVSLPISMTGAV